MTRRGRVCAVILLAVAGSFLTAAGARADHCPPVKNPEPIPGFNTSYCHTPKPTATPKPTPTPKPTAAPTSAPRPVATARPAGPASTPFDVDGVEVPETTSLATPEILVDPIDNDDEQALEAETSASASSWIFGFIVGLVIGLLVGRASWGIRRKRRQQIFG